MIKQHEGTIQNDIDKQLVELENEIKDPILLRNEIALKCKNLKGKNFLLYSKEQSDFTILRNKNNNKQELVNIIFDVLTDRGTVLCIKENDDLSIDFWIKDKNSEEQFNNYLYKLFECSDWVEVF